MTTSNGESSNPTKTLSTTSSLTDVYLALNALADQVEWLNYRKVEYVEEVLAGWPRYEIQGVPNKKAAARAAEIRAIAKWLIWNTSKKTSPQPQPRTLSTDATQRE